MCVKECEEVKKGLAKQECITADATGAIFWEDNVGILEEGNSYKLSELMVRMYNSKKYLTIPKDNIQTTGIADIGDIEEYN